MDIDFILCIITYYYHPFLCCPNYPRFDYWEPLGFGQRVLLTCPNHIWNISSLSSITRYYRLISRTFSVQIWNLTFLQGLLLLLVREWSLNVLLVLTRVSLLLLPCSRQSKEYRYIYTHLSISIPIYLQIFIFIFMRSTWI